jgi:uncharacterized protein (TIGR02996 family)
MTTLTMPEVFLQDIIAHPEDDAPRLVYADWLEEHGDGARAEFIRVQCELAKKDRVADQLKVPVPLRSAPRYDALRRRERGLLEAHRRAWTALVPGVTIDAWSLDEPTLPYTYGVRALFRRGFVAEVTLALADFCGGPCGRCGGVGAIDHDPIGGPDPDDGRLYVEAPPSRWECPACRGTGRAPGHGPALVRAAPLERVTLSDREPGRYTGCWAWFMQGGLGRTESQLPDCLFDLIPPAPRAERQEALDALSEACLVWARSQPATS